MTDTNDEKVEAALIRLCEIHDYRSSQLREIRAELAAALVQPTHQQLQEYANARVQADRITRHAEPQPWMQNIDAAMKEPLFNELRALMGTENTGQDIALLQTLRRFRAKAAIAQPVQPTADVKDTEIARMRIALTLIAEANQSVWDTDHRQPADFKLWAQDRARSALGLSK